MQYREYTVYTTTQASELVADILTELGSQGVGIYDSNDFAALLSSDVIWDYVDEQALIRSEIVRVKGYFGQDCADEVGRQLRARLDELAARCPFPYGSLEIAAEQVDDQDWVNVWRKQYRPVSAGRVTVVPDWIAYTPIATDEVVVRMDPGMAFGTGEHETTRLCLRMLQDLNLDGATVADVGTGSGILAIAAALLGASRVDAYDIDPLSVKAADANARANGVADRVRVAHADLLDRAQGRYPFVIANITADILIALASQLRAYLAPGGTVILSGIIHARKQDVLDAFVADGFALVQAPCDGEWCGLMLRKRAE